MRIIQLSDLHVVPPGKPLSGRVETLPFLERAVAAVERLIPRADLIIITGDLVEAGTAEEYSLAKAALERLTVPYLVLPGNHDQRTNLRAAFAGRMGRVLRHDCLAFQHQVGDLNVVALDSVIPLSGQGRLGEVQLQWLKTLLDKDSRRPTLLALHHPPFDVGIPFMDRLGLQDRDQLIQVISGRENVVGVVAGHVHRTIVGRAGRVTAIVGPSTAHQIPLEAAPDGPETFVFEPPGYLLHEWDGRVLRSHHCYIDSFGPWFRFDQKA